MYGRIWGLVLFGIGFGIVIGLLTEKSIWTLLLSILLLMMGYHLFCRKWR